MADGADVRKTEDFECLVEELADSILVKLVKLFIEGDAVDFLDGLVDEETEEDDGRTGGREVVFAVELVLAWAGFVELQVPGEAERALGGHAAL